MDPSLSSSPHRLSGPRKRNHRGRATELGIEGIEVAREEGHAGKGHKLRAMEEVMYRGAMWGEVRGGPEEKSKERELEKSVEEPLGVRGNGHSEDHIRMSQREGDSR